MTFFLLKKNECNSNTHFVMAHLLNLYFIGILNQLVERKNHYILDNQE